MKPWPSHVAAFLTNDFAGILRKAGYTLANCPIPPEVVGWLLERERAGEISRKALRSLLRDTLVELKKEPLPCPPSNSQTPPTTSCSSSPTQLAKIPPT